MFVVSGNNLKMAEGDYGIELPLTFSGLTFSNSDRIKIKFKTGMNAETVLEQEYTPSNGKIILMFTAAESALFKVGDYVYSLDWYQNDAFMCNLILAASFKVVDKA